jgi:hypothetical protein
MLPKHPEEMVDIRINEWLAPLNRTEHKEERQLMLVVQCKAQSRHGASKVSVIICIITRVVMIEDETIAAPDHLTVHAMPNFLALFSIRRAKCRVIGCIEKTLTAVRDYVGHNPWVREYPVEGPRKCPCTSLPKRVGSKAVRTYGKGEEWLLWRGRMVSNTQRA